MTRFRMILQEIFRLVRRNKLYFLLPVLLSLGILAIMVYSAGPAAFFAFIYAGI